MKLLNTLLLLALGATAPSAFGASVTLPDFSTGWNEGGTVFKPHVESSNEWLVNLDDRTGLTPGADIRITVTTDDHFLWVGGFRPVAGSFTVSSKATLALLLGGHSSNVSSLIYEDFGTLSEGGAGEPGSAVTDVAGYMMGPGLPALEITVPWDTDLTQAAFSLAQVSDISGPGFYASSITISGGTAAGSSSTFAVHMVSVPEPSGAMLLGLGLMSLTAFRRRNQGQSVGQ